MGPFNWETYISQSWEIFLNYVIDDSLSCTPSFLETLLFIYYTSPQIFCCNFWEISSIWIPTLPWRFSFVTLFFILNRSFLYSFFIASSSWFMSTESSLTSLRILIGYIFLPLHNLCFFQIAFLEFVLIFISHIDVFLRYLHPWSSAYD